MVTSSLLRPMVPFPRSGKRNARNEKSTKMLTFMNDDDDEDDSMDNMFGKIKVNRHLSFICSFFY